MYTLHCKLSISVWGLLEAIIVFILLWAAAGAANRFIAHWLMTSTKLTYSDRTLIQRVIKREFGDSTVNLQLRVWIDDPRNGIANVEDAILLAVWDRFHANGIEIAFPQRDLHIKSAVPLNISKDSAQPPS